MSEFILDVPRSEQGKRGLIRTFTGLYVNPLNLRDEDIVIEDIAHHLSLECRYTGACPYHYSVAQHSVYVSHFFSHPVYALAALLHDASEAYLKDLPSPVKHDPRMSWYREIEDEVTGRIFNKFNLDARLAKFIKVADDATFEDEIASFWGGTVNHIHAWLPANAERAFLAAFARHQQARTA